jgi:hypothetical protein
MNKSIKIITALFTVLFSVASCEDVNVLESEQYIKQVYIIGASDVVWPFDVSFSSEPQAAYISLATGGSQNIDRDVTVKLGHNDAIIDWYNNKYMYDAPVQYQKLDEAYYSIPSMETVIKAGEVYTRLPFTITTEGLHCDSLYSITFEIESVSAYEKNPEDSVLILNFNLVNEYSGVYQLNAARYSVNSAGNVSPLGSLSVSRTLRAVDENSVRFFNEAKAEIRSGYASNEAYFAAIENFCLTFVKADENNTFSVVPWDKLNIVEGSCTYENEVFTFQYDYMDGNTRYRIIGTLNK